ncbi:hypothetical protein B0H14DRAFT_3460172 [Mycena olivaceomarginata]|nr:hypothetical protein B0H14DRAFT_3460172 [Mycena olivaceomarginata]
MVETVKDKSEVASRQGKAQKAPFRVRGLLFDMSGWRLARPVRPLPSRIPCRVSPDYERRASQRRQSDYLRPTFVLPMLSFDLRSRWLMLRCQTCPQAFCTDCVDWDRITMVGDTIPEFVLRGFGKRDGIFFIRCPDCCEQAKVDPEWIASWESEISESQRLVGLM